jgi:hypothetical protein
VKSRLGDARAKTFTFPDAFPDIPFVYRAMEWARPRAQIALVTHARWLFPGKADKARIDLLQSVQITGLLNGTALRETSVWPNSRAPFAILFACNTKPEHGGAFQFVSPQVSDKQQKAQRLLRIDWNDAKVVSVNNAVTKPWVLKTRFRGTGFDEQILDRLMAAHPSLVDYVEKTLGTTIRNGYRVGNRKNSIKWLRDMPCITPQLNKSAENQPEPSIGFWVAPNSLLPCGETQVEASRPRDAYAAPLLLVRQSPPANPSDPRAVIAGAESKFEVAFSQSWHGASFAQVDDGLEQARWLQLLLQSKVFLFFALLTDGAFGVERDRYVLETLKAFPVIPLDRLAKPQRRVALELSEALWTSGWSEALEKRIDKLVFDAYDLDDIDRDNVCDTLDTSLPYAKNRRRALTPPKAPEIKRFTEVLQEELSYVLTTSNERARVRLRTDVNTGPWSVLQIDRLTHKTRVPGDIAIPWAKVLQEADASGATLVTVNTDPVTTFAAILHHYRYWTPTRARMLALSILEGKRP